MSKKKTFTPLSGITLTENRILIKKFEKEEKSRGGIILPDDQQEAPEGGVIVAIGPDLLSKHSTACIPSTVIQVGLKVRYVQHGMSVKIDGVEYYLLRSTDVWGILD